MTTKQKIAATKATPARHAATHAGIGPARQTQGRMRRVRHLRSSRSRQPDLPRPLRAAASRPGERGHRRIGRRAGAHLEVDGARRRRVLREDARKTARQHRHRPRALLDRRRQQRRQRAADSDRVRARADRDRAQRQSRQRQRAQRRARPARGDFSDEHRHRSDSAPVRAVARRVDRRGDRRGDFARAGRVFAGADDEGSADRRARSARLPSAGARASRRCGDRVLGDVRARSDRRDLRSRCRARRGRHRQRRPA